MAEFTEWLFHDLLRIPTEYVSGVFLNDFVNLILLPSIVLIIFLTAAAEAFLPAKMREKWKILLAVSFYLVIITQGFYPMFAIFISNYVILFIIAAFSMFAITRFIKMEYWKAATVAAIKYGEKKRDIKLIEDEIKFLKKELNLVMRELRKPGLTKDERNYWDGRRRELENRIEFLQNRLKELKKFP